MNHKNILSRAWDILWRYKTLWVFGIILALTTATFTDRVFQFSDNTEHVNQRQEPPAFLGESFQEGIEDLSEGIDKLFTDVIPEEIFRTIVTISILLGCFILVLIILRFILRYISETAIIIMVDEYDSTGGKKSWRQGFRIGWSRSAWKLFLIDLIINLPLVIIFVSLFALGLLPLFAWTSANPYAGIFGSVLAIGSSTLVIFMAIIIVALLSLLKHFFRRACVLDDRDVIGAISHGFNTVRSNFKDVLLMWLIIIGIQIGFGIVIIPIFLMMVIAGGLVGGIFGLVAGGITSLFANGELPIIVGAVVGTPIFLMVLIAPLAFLTGLRETFTSTTWTLTYCELRTLENLDPILENISSNDLDEPLRVQI